MTSLLLGHLDRGTKYKAAVFSYKCINSFFPKYLSIIVFKHELARSLRSSNKGLSSVIRFKKNGDRSFSAAALTIWNDLTLSLRNIKLWEQLKHARNFSFRKTLYYAHHRYLLFDIRMICID